MRKLLRCLFLLLMASFSALAGAEYDGMNDLPPAVADYLAASDRWAGHTVTGWANPAGQEDGFVALNSGDDNDLLCFRLTDGVWQYAWHNDGALPDNGQPFRLEDGTGSRDLYTDEVYTQPRLWSYYVLDGELCDFSCGWSKRDQNWLLDSYTLYEPGELSVKVCAGRLDFWLSDADEEPHRVEGVIERSLRYIDVQTLPCTVAEAERQLSLPPQIPQGELTAQRILFTGGKRYKVWQGPGESFGQAGGGKAVVSTNDWIQVFGRQDDWILIQYDITSERMRIGWIPAGALPAGTQVPDLPFSQGQMARAAVDGAVVTDDPLFSQIAIALLPLGEEVARLCTMGEWSYVLIYSDTAPMYGFVKTDMLALESVPERGRRQGAHALTEVYGYTQEEVDTRFEFRTTVQDNELTVVMYPADEPGWVYEAVFDLQTGKHIRSLTPFATGYEGYPGEGSFRYVLDTALEKGWLYNWQWEDRALLRQWIIEWKLPMTDKLAQGLETGDITPWDAATELFTGSYGPREHWTQALIDWHAKVFRHLQENYPANG